MLADDYELGNRIAKAGGKILLSRSSQRCTQRRARAASGTSSALDTHRTAQRPLSFLASPHARPSVGFARGADCPNLLDWRGISRGVSCSAGLTMAWTWGAWGVRDERSAAQLWPGSIARCDLFCGVAGELCIQSHSLGAATNISCDEGAWSNDGIGIGRPARCIERAAKRQDKAQWSEDLSVTIWSELAWARTFRPGIHEVEPGIMERFAIFL